MTITKIVGAAVVLLLLAQDVDAASGRWTAARSTEDWGTFCTTSFKINSGIEFGFHGSPGSYTAAYINSDNTKFPQTINLSLQTDAGELHNMQGELNDYLGKPEFNLKSPDLLKEIAKGKSLSVSVSGMRPITIPLASFGQALRDFSKCMTN